MTSEITEAYAEYRDQCLAAARSAMLTAATSHPKDSAVARILGQALDALDNIDAVEATEQLIKAVDAGRMTAAAAIAAMRGLTDDPNAVLLEALERQR